MQSHWGPAILETLDLIVLVLLAIISLLLCYYRWIKALECWQY